MTKSVQVRDSIQMYFQYQEEDMGRIKIIAGFFFQMWKLIPILQHVLHLRKFITTPSTLYIGPI